LIFPQRDGAQVFRDCALQPSDRNFSSKPEGNQGNSGVMQRVLLCWMDSISKYAYGAFRRMINRSFHLAACRRRVFSIQLPLSYHGQNVPAIENFLLKRGMTANGGAGAKGTC
jgi:hypothetical protein